ncbi:hypothetical protein, partial [Calidithermus terrae]|uniref:hypothetical protein n=1 Tax=Calidithermus terrae TaxID=1408545 RepID=UPI0011C3FC5B
MPVYGGRSREQRSLAPARPQARKAEEWVSEALDSLPLPHRPTPPTRETEEPRRPRATWTPEGEEAEGRLGLVLHPHDSPLQRKARLGREWLHLQIQRYRRRLEETREAPEGLAGRIQQ